MGTDATPPSRPEPDPKRPLRAVVTGGTGALGRAVVRELLEQGLEVHVPWMVSREVEALETELGGSPERLRLRQADVTDPGSVEALFGALGEGGGNDGGLHALCNLVGGFGMAPVEATEPETWRRMVDLNATSAFLCCRAAVPLLRRRGGGRIVNVAAMPVLERGGARMSAYAAAKAAVAGLTHALARELLADGIAVNALAPRIIDTEANRRAMPDADTSTWLTPREIARVLAFLVGPDGAPVTGNVLALERGNVLALERGSVRR